MTEAIKTVIANYSNSDGYSYFRSQVGAVARTYYITKMKIITIKTPEQVNYINSEVGHLIEQHTQNEQSVVNPTRNLFPAIESAYDTDITGVSNPCYDESEDLSTLTDNLQFQG